MAKGITLESLRKKASHQKKRYAKLKGKFCTHCSSTDIGHYSKVLCDRCHVKACISRHKNSLSLYEKLLAVIESEEKEK